MTESLPGASDHGHVFLGAGHAEAERRTWAVVALCTVMMVAEIVGGALFGSIALVADGLHMSTHAGALLLAAWAYRYARNHAQDRRFSFGTGKLGDLAGYTSAIVLAMIALLIAVEAARRFIDPVPIHFSAAIPIAGLGLVVNIASAWLLGAGSPGHDHGQGHGHGHGQGHGHSHGHPHGHDDAPRALALPGGRLRLEIFEAGVPPVFRIRADGALPAAASVTVETLRPDGTAATFAFADHGGYLESRDPIPEPHEFTAVLRLATAVEVHTARAHFAEHALTAGHAAAHRDNNMRAAVVHVMADAAVSVLVILGLVCARAFGWMWMDPLVGLVGAAVIASWAYGLTRDTGGVLLDMTPDRELEGRIRATLEADGDRVSDLHLWRLGPGHLGAIVAITTSAPHEADDYHRRLAGFPTLSHVTIEIRRPR